RVAWASGEERNANAGPARSGGTGWGRGWRPGAGYGPGRADGPVASLPRHPHGAPEGLVGARRRGAGRDGGPRPGEPAARSWFVAEPGSGYSGDGRAEESVRQGGAVVGQGAARSARPGRTIADAPLS